MVFFLFIFSIFKSTKKVVGSVLGAFVLARLEGFGIALVHVKWCSRDTSTTTQHGRARRRRTTAANSFDARDMSVAGTTPLAGITVEAVREQLEQLGHTDVSETVISEFLQQLAAESGAARAAHASADDDDDVDDEDEGGAASTTTPRATLRALDGEAYTTAARPPAAKDSIRKHKTTTSSHDGTRPRSSSGAALGGTDWPPLKSPTSPFLDAAHAASSPCTASSPAHKRVAHATPGGVHATRRGPMKGSSPSPVAVAAAAAAGTRRPSSASGTPRSRTLANGMSSAAAAGTAPPSPPPRLDFSSVGPRGGGIGGDGNTHAGRSTPRASSVAGDSVHSVYSHGVASSHAASSLHCHAAPVRGGGTPFPCIHL